LKKEGEQGRKVINQYTRYGTVILGTLQAYGIAVGLEASNVVADPGWFFRISTVLTLVGGTMFLMWLGEQITARGIGNGISLIIFAGIVAAMPSAIAQLLEQGRTGAISTATSGGESNLPDWLAFVVSYLGRGQPMYLVLFGALIAFFAFFYTAIVFNPKETADNLKNQGGFIPGVRPGERTAEHIDYVLTRITVVGAIYLVFVCLVPEVFMSNVGISAFLGGTSLLIMVSVTMDTVAQVQGHLLAQQYEGLMKKRVVILAAIAARAITIHLRSLLLMELVIAVVALNLSAVLMTMLKSCALG